MPVGVVAGHWLLVVGEEDEELLWVADKGVSASPGEYGTYLSQRRASGQHGSAVKLTLGGSEQLRLAAPPLSVYEEGTSRPPTSPSTNGGTVGG